PEVRGCDGNDRPQRARALLDVHGSRKLGTGARQKSRVEPTARVTDQAERATTFGVEQPRRGLGEEGSPPLKRRSRARADDLDLPPDTELRQNLDQEFAHVCEVRKVSQLREAEEPWDEQHVVRAGHALIVSCQLSRRASQCIRLSAN